jgi:predicted TIM-barrel fold metal-dependent hydrolase
VRRMMIIDADTHIAPTGGAFAVEKLVERAAAAGVARCLTWLRPDYDGTGIETHNAYVYESVKRYPDKLYGFGWADPTVGVEHAKDMVRRCVSDYGLCGVKLNGAQNFTIDDPALALPVIEEIARTGTRLAFHIGPDAYEGTHPLRAERVARLFPELRILMVHMGMHDTTMNKAVIEVAGRCPGMTLVGSGTRMRSVLDAIRVLGADRVCFGSDSPFGMMHVELAAYRAMLTTEVGKTEADLVLGGTMLRFLGAG